jgi:hypothetical protein
MMPLILAAIVAASPVAVLPLVPTVEVEYSVKPTASQAATLTHRVRAGLASPTLGLSFIRVSELPATPCADALCAQKIGAAIGARTVVFGTVDRYTGILWNARLTAIDVKTGHQIASITYGADGKDFMIGDYDTLLTGFQQLGVCLGRSMTGRPHCTSY